MLLETMMLVETRSFGTPKSICLSPSQKADTHFTAGLPPTLKTFSAPPLARYLPASGVASHPTLSLALAL